MADLVNQIFELFERHGSELYGESLSLESHMLQTAARAEAFGASPSLIAAALLHDIGHLLEASGQAGALSETQFEHERAGADFLVASFDSEVTDPIALHVQAKRFLCAVDPSYYGRLSNASRASLRVQGGAMTPNEVLDFQRHPAFDHAVLLRRFDDDGKETAAPARRLENYRPLLLNCVKIPKG